MSRNGWRIAADTTHARPDAATMVVNSPAAHADSAHVGPRGIKFVPFLDVAPFPPLVHHVLGWKMPNSVKRTIWLALFAVASFVWIVLVTFSYLPAAAGAGAVCVIGTVFFGLQGLALLADQPWLLLDTDTSADIAVRNALSHRRWIGLFVFCLTCPAVQIWAVYDLAGMHAMYLAIGAALVQCLNNIFTTAAAQLTIHYSQQLDVLLHQLSAQMQAGKVSFKQAVAWASVLSKRVTWMNSNYIWHEQIMLICTTAVSVLYTYTFVALNSHPAFVIVAGVTFLGVIEAFLRAAGFNNAVEKLRFQVNLMRSPNDEVHM